MRVLDGRASEAHLHGMRHLLSSLAITAAMTAGCGDSAGPELDLILAVETDKPGYSLGADRVARVTLINRSARPIYLPMGSYLAYERLVDGEWRDTFEWFAIDGIGRSLPLDGGTARTDQLELWAYLADRPGTYRFHYRLYADPELTALIPLEERVSAPFTVTR
jgi:hypothetical protein